MPARDQDVVAQRFERERRNSNILKRRVTIVAIAISEEQGDEFEWGLKVRIERKILQEHFAVHRLNKALAVESTAVEGEDALGRADTVGAQNQTDWSIGIDGATQSLAVHAIGRPAIEQV